MKKLLLIIGFIASAAVAVGSVKNLPYGIFWLPAVATSASQDPTDWRAWKNGHVVGVVARLSWEYLEPSEGQYNWAYLDAVNESAQNAGILWEIEIACGAKDGADTAFYPSWVVTDGAKTVTLHSNTGVPATICVPWDPVFQAKWQALIRALGARYDTAENLRAVQMTGVGRDGECYFCSNNPKYISDWEWVLSQTPDGTVAEGEQLWVNAAETIAGYYANAFSQTPFLYSTGAPMPRSVDRKNTAMSSVVSALNTTYNVGHLWRFGTRSSGYHYNGTVDPWGARYGIFFQGYQQNKPQKSGTAQEASQAYQSPYNGLWFEVYAGDCMIDSNFSAFDTFNSKTAAMVGSSAYQ
ncbi:MAG: beta-galactosidase [Verrucomicrobia bacterium]|nr:beta-galactosidase [Verrucomicrobiota bacterium]MBV8482508.1 beta-galactosidase [Verrucomicrobiota bacterium]